MSFGSALTFRTVLFTGAVALAGSACTNIAGMVQSAVNSSAVGFSYEGCSSATVLTPTSLQVGFEFPDDTNAINIYRDGELIYTATSANFTTYTDRNLTIGTSYTYQCERITTDGRTVLGDQAQTITPNVGFTFAGIASAENLDSTQVRVTWTAAQNKVGSIMPSIKGYTVYSVDSSTLQLTALKTINSASAVSTVVKPLSANTLYTFRVRAFDTAGNSDSNEADAMAFTYGGLSNASQISTTQVAFTYPAAEDAEAINIYCKKTSDPNWPATTAAHIINTSSTAVTLTGPGVNTWASYPDGTSFTCKAQALMDGNADTNIVEKSFSFSLGDPFVTGSYTGCATEGAATSDSQVLGPTSARIRFAFPASAISVNIYRNGTLVGSSSTASSPFEDTGLTTGTTYRYTCEAVNAAGAKLMGSTTVALTPSLNLGFSGATKAENVSGTTAVISWDKAASALTAGYTIYQSLDHGATLTPLLTVPSSKSSAVIANGLTPGSIVYFRVRAFDSSGNSEMNNKDVAAFMYPGITGATVTGATSANLNFNSALYGEKVSISCKSKNPSTGIYSDFGEIYNTSNLSPAPDLSSLTSASYGTFTPGWEYTCRARAMATTVVGDVWDTNTATTTFVPVGEADHLTYQIQPPATAVAGTAFPVRVAILDNDSTSGGNVVVAGADASASIALTVTPANGLFGTTAVNATKGVASFSIYLKTAGTYTLSAVTTRASDSATITLTSSPFIVQPDEQHPSAARTLITANPSTITAASLTISASNSNRINLGVTLKDAYDNVIKNAQIRPILSSDIQDPESNVLMPSPTQDASTGIWSTTFRTKKSGVVTISDGTSGAVKLITVNPGVAASLAFVSQPSEYTQQVSDADGLKRVSVQILDANGNVVTTSSEVVTLAVEHDPNGNNISSLNCIAGSIGCTQNGNRVSTTAVNGVATFDSTVQVNKSTPSEDCSIDFGSGCFTISASTSSLSVMSSPFAVTAGAASQLAIKGTDGSGGVTTSFSIAGVPLCSPGMRVQSQNSNGDAAKFQGSGRRDVAVQAAGPSLSVGTLYSDFSCSTPLASSNGVSYVSINDGESLSSIFYFKPDTTSHYGNWTITAGSSALPSTAPITSWNSSKFGSVVIEAQPGTPTVTYPGSSFYITSLSSPWSVTPTSIYADHYSISGTLPSGLTFNTSTGAISGTPTGQVATSGYTVTVYNTKNASSTASLSITVDSLAPTITSFAPSGGLSFNLVFSEPINANSLTTSDITESGTTKADSWSITNPSNDLKTFVLTAPAAFGAGTVLPAISAGAVTDLAGNANTSGAKASSGAAYSDSQQTVSLITTESTSTDSGNGNAIVSVSLTAAKPYDVVVGYNLATFWTTAFGSGTSSPGTITIPKGSTQASQTVNNLVSGAIVGQGKAAQFILTGTNSNTVSVGTNQVLRTWVRSTNVDYFTDVQPSGDNSSRFTCGLTNSGAIYCWGDNTNGQLGDGTRTYHVQPKPISANSSGSTYKKLSVGSSHVCAIDTSDKLWCWGLNTSGQLGIGGVDSPKTSPQAVDQNNTYSDISIGEKSSCAIRKSDSKLYCWGNSGSGRLGNGTLSPNLSAPALTYDSLTYGTTYSAVSSGVSHVCAIASGNVNPANTGASNLYCFGYNGWGAIGNNTTTNALTPQVVSGSLNFATISAGYGFNCGIVANSGALKCWGLNNSGQVGNGNTTTGPNAAAGTNTYLPGDVDPGTSYSLVSAGARGSGSGWACGITSANILKCWGANNWGQLGIGSITNSSLPVAVSTGTTYRSVASGDNTTCAITFDNTLQCWGSNTDGQLGIESNPTTLPLGNQTYGSPLAIDNQSTFTVSAPGVTPSPSESSIVALGGSSACGITSGNILKCWGDNSYGQLGDGSGSGHSAPAAVQPSSQDPFISIAAGQRHACGITASHALKCWGDQTYGRLGNSVTSGFVNTPQLLVEGTKFIAVSAGEASTCAITEDNTLKCWGSNGYGLLGNNSTSDQSSAGNGNVYQADPANPTKYVAVSLGQYHTCAITTTGTLQCWGYHGNGRLGICSTPAAPVKIPTTIDPGTTYQAVAAGIRHTCAITTAGILKCWGGDYSGTLGNGSGTADVCGPTDASSSIADSDKYVSVASGYDSTCGITTSGTLKCWGRNDYGQIGVGSTTNQANPTQIGINYKQAWNSLNGFHTCALSKTNQLSCWGLNDKGQLGTGENQYRPASVW